MTGKLTPIGCDVSQNDIAIAIMLDSVEEKFIDFKIENSRKGYDRLHQKIQDLGIQPKIMMEATGNYYEDLADYLTDLGYWVNVANPLKVKNFSRAQFQRTKTDKQDARLIARYCDQIKVKGRYVKPTPMQHQIRRSLSGLKQLNKDLNALKNRIKVTKDSFLKNLLAKHEQMIEASIKELKAHIIELTAQSEAAKTADLVATIPSIGQLTASTLAHYLNLYKFQTENRFIAFAGLCPKKEESGTSVKKSDRLSEYGNRMLKGSLYMSALVCLKLGYFAPFVARLKKRNKPNKVIIVALMRKLAAIAWHLHTKKEPFDKARYAMQ